MSELYVVRFRRQYRVMTDTSQYSSKRFSNASYPYLPSMYFSSNRIVKAFGDEAAASAFAQSYIPIEHNPFDGGMDEDDEAIDAIRFRYYEEAGGEIVPLNDISELAVQFGLTPPDLSVPPGEVYEWYDWVIKWGEWWTTNLEYLTPEARRAFWQLLDPNPLIVTSVPFEE